MAEVPVANSGETLIEHPEIPGAVMRIPSTAFDPAVHTPWPEGQVPWMDGAGHALGEAPARRKAPEPSRKSRAAPSSSEADE